MQLAGVDAWVVICRENANDPLAMHIGGENAGGTAAFLFTLLDGAVASTALSPWGEAVGLSEMQVHDRVVPLEDPSTIWTDLARILTEINPKAIAVNSSAKNVADGLSHTLRLQMEAALPAELRGRLVSSENLVAEWLSVKLPQEVEIMRQAGELTVQIELEAYSRIVPGETRDSEVAAFIQSKVAELGLGFGWSPAHNPSVNSGFPRGHAGASDKLIIPGDFMQTDFGIKVFDVWCTDYQRFAYVLSPGEMEPPQEALHKFEIARRGHRIALAAMKPGATGLDVDSAQRRWMEQNGSRPVKWGTGHPVGYWAHDIGPALTGGQREVPPPDSLRVLRPGQTFAFDGFFAWEDARPYGTAERLISVEEMAVVTEHGAEYLIPPQEELVLIKSQ
jgi:Xaa-Pro aminopeptidase